MNSPHISIDQLGRIHIAYANGHPPLLVARYLRLAPMTVIAEYVRLDTI